MTSRARFRRYLAQRAAPQDHLAEPTDDLGSRPKGHKASRGFFALLGSLLSLMVGQRAQLLFPLATVTLSTLVSLLGPGSTKVVLDYVLTDNPGPSAIPAWAGGGPDADRVALLWTIGLALLGATIFTVLLGTWGRWLMTRLTKRTQTRLRRRAFRHAMTLPLARVHALKSGGLASILREDTGGAADLLFSLIYNPWRAVIQLAGTLAILAWVDWRMLVGAFLLIPITWITHQTWIARIRPVHRDIRQTRTTIDAHATESFGGLRVVRAFAQHRAETSRFARGQHYMTRQELFIWWWSRLIESLWAILIPIASGALMVYGGSAVLRGDLTLGDIMMFTTYLVMLLGPLETLTSTATNVQSNLAALDRVLDLMNEPREFHAARPADAPPPLRITARDVRGEISLRNVTFRYPGRDQDVLRNISLTVRPGETVALVGASGAGKTTLCNLVARFYDPAAAPGQDQGQVLLDGIDLRDIEVDSYRTLLGIVEQDVFLFDGTIADNIAYGRGKLHGIGRRNVAMEQIERAARAAHAHDFIGAMERGYQTVIGERGVRLSGGQKQRIAIARALLADPRILILDEATSNLDAQSEALIQRSLADLLKGRTSFVIAHRLSTIRNADRIVVLDQGRIAEIGTHDALLAAGGRYAQLLRTQVQTSPEQPTTTGENAGEDEGDV
jgi:ATP-binding cassette subfamily B protein/subfamily B ATP-binding cassette protein MsbA